MHYSGGFIPVYWMHSCKVSPYPEPVLMRNILMLSVVAEEVSYSANVDVLSNKHREFLLVNLSDVIRDYFNM